MSSKIIAFLICIFLFGCGSAEKAFDYNNTDVTDGLSITPATLALVADNETKFFSLHFSDKNLFLLRIDYAGLDDNFSIDVPLEPNECRENISASEQGCRLYVRYTPKEAGDHSGTIALYFIYTADAAGSNKTKEQRLLITGTN